MFVILRPGREYFAHIETSPFPVKRSKIKAYVLQQRPLITEGSVTTLFTFSLSSPDSLRQFQPNLAQCILGWWGFDGPRPFSRGDNYEKAIIHWRNLKLFSSTTGQFQPNLAHSFLRWKGLDVLQIRTIQFQKRDNGIFLLIINVMIYFIVLHKCVYWFELVSQMSDVAHGPIVFQVFCIILTSHGVISMIFVQKIKEALSFLFADVFYYLYRTLTLFWHDL